MLHLTDNAGITGASRAASPYRHFLPGFGWHGVGRTAVHRIQLKDYVALDPPLNRNSFLGDAAFGDELRAILGARGSRGLFYNRDLDLNQGAYLTEAPAELVSLLNRAYAKVCGEICPFVDAEPAPAEPAGTVPFTIENAAEDLFIDLERLERTLAVWNAKKNLILEGPPGVGKTFAARRLAYALIGSEAKDRLEFVQFHQSYSMKTSSKVTGRPRAASL